MPVVSVANWLNAHAPDNAVIETYDDELFFLLNRPYHYPPDQVSIDITRRTELGQQVTIAYDPLVANPDYLVVGSFSHEAHLYDSVLTSDEFQLLVREGPYDIYQRFR